MKVRGQKVTSDSFGNAEIHCTEEGKTVLVALVTLA